MLSKKLYMQYVYVHKKTAYILRKIKEISDSLKQLKLKRKGKEFKKKNLTLFSLQTHPCCKWTPPATLIP